MKTKNKMKKILITAVLIVMSCSSNKTITSKKDIKLIGDTRTKAIEFINKDTYLLTETSDDPTYGYDESNPIKVGGVHEKEGPLNERRFLNALYGPNNIKMIFYRTGSCCPFQTPNGFIENSGMLDHFRIVEMGGRDTLSIYINMYDKGDLKIPLGLRALEKE